MTKKEWDPFSEADKNLDKYSYFFDQNELEKSSDEHPQVMEDFMIKNCPQNFCYVWLWTDLHRTGIDGLLVGVPKNIAFAIKLSTGVDPLDASRYDIGRLCYKDDFVMYLKE